VWAPQATAGDGHSSSSSEEPHGAQDDDASTTYSSDHDDASPANEGPPLAPVEKAFVYVAGGLVNAADISVCFFHRPQVGHLWCHAAAGR